MNQIHFVTERSSKSTLESKEVVMKKMNISDDYLLRAHRNAVTLKLDRNFICILEKEIKRRNLLLYR
ncbi:hypothetical protein BLL40_10590 [Domibacillus mangrovi]|uniref:Sporulation protein n=1 Tax=Domibacillus mangrovi TaxID=1714354 RepID=A0A1Q5P287_9BACI|nr:hypothetical protein BLL40_10590 [Domibacillus mangrovi]